MREVTHYILNLNPQADYDWDKCVLRNPLTGERIDLTNAIAEAVNQEPGSYLISINIDVIVLLIGLQKLIAPRLRAINDKFFIINKNNLEIICVYTENYGVVT